MRSGVDFRVLYQGDLQVDRHHVEQIMVSDTASRATLRPWLWKDLEPPVQATRCRIGQTPS